MTVSLRNHLLLVYPVSLGTGLQLARILTQTQGATQHTVFVLARQEVDNRIRCCRINFLAVSFVQLAHIACKLDNGNLHTETQSQIWNLVLAGVTGRIDFAFDTTRAKAARDNDTVGTLQQSACGFLRNILRVNPFDFKFSIIIDRCMFQGFHHTDIGVLQLDILTHQGNLCAMGQFLATQHHILPVMQVFLFALDFQAFDNLFRQTFFLQCQRHFIQRWHVGILDYTIQLHIAEQ